MPSAPTKKTPQPRVAIYARVSTRDQNLAGQIAEVKAYCDRRGWTEIKIFSEKAGGGAKSSRTVLDKLMQLVRCGKFDVIVVHKLDRMGRSMLHFVQLVTELRTLGVGVIAPSQGIDTTSDNPAAELTMNVLGAVAKFERDLVLERTKMGLDQARREGRVGGRPRKNDARLEAARILREKGFTFKQIAKKTRLSAGYLCRALSETKKEKEAFKK